jgi:hypothetical protein
VLRLAHRRFARVRVARPLKGLAEKAIVLATWDDVDVEVRHAL